MRTQHNGKDGGGCRTELEPIFGVGAAAVHTSAYNDFI
jgi:hypothetical protein